MKAGYGYTADSGNPQRLKLIKELRKKEAGIWKSVAKRLSKRRRERIEVTLSDLSSLAGDQTLLVPGIVVGSGEIRGKVNVAALRFTAGARDRIEAAGGRCMTIEELAAAKPSPSTLRIVG